MHRLPSLFRPRVLTAAAVFALAAGVTVALAGDPKMSEKQEAASHPEMMKQEAPETATIGLPAPDFTLTDLEGNEHTLSEYLAQGHPVVLEWFNPDCPFVKKHHQKYDSMVSTYTEFNEKGVIWLAVNSGAPGKQGAGLEHNRAAAKEYGMDYPVLLDESGEVGRAYGAKTTPQLFVILPDRTLVYNGPLDEIANPVDLGQENYVEDILNDALAGKKVEAREIKSYGCSVKYAS